MALADLGFLLAVVGRAGSSEAEGARDVGVGSAEFEKESEGAGDGRAERMRVAAIFFGVPVRPMREAEAIRPRARVIRSRGKDASSRFSEVKSSSHSGRGFRLSRVYCVHFL